MLLLLCAYHYARRGNGGPQDPNEWKYGILRAAEEVMRAGVLSNAPGSERTCFTRFTVHRLVRFCWWVGCWGLVVFVFCFCGFLVWIADQSMRSSYQPMTSLAYLHDCHYCYNERSNVQKKNMPPKCNTSYSLDRMMG